MAKQAKHKLTSKEQLSRIAQQFQTRVEIFTSTFENVGAEIENVHSTLENLRDDLERDLDLQDYLDSASLEDKREVFNYLLSEFVPADDLRRVVEMVLKTVAPRWSAPSDKNSKNPLDKNPKKKK